MANNLEMIFDENGIIKKFKSDYVPRPSQIQGAELIHSALSTNVNAIIEGPTGYGKTFAYLVPIFENIAQSGFNKKAVIVTNGISLQEQLFYKDIPLVTQIFHELYPYADFKFCLLKGKQNFVCPNKIVQLYEKGMTSENNFTKEVEDEVKKIVDWSYSTTTGDFSELDFVPSYEAACAVSCNKQGECTGRKCPRYSECHYQEYRKACTNANIIVTNYHMLFADHQTGGSILPKYDILACDEAHEICGIYRDFVGYKASVNTIKNIRNNISEILNKNKRLKDQYEDNLRASYMVACAENYFKDIRKGIFQKWEDVKLLDNVVLQSDVDMYEALSNTESVMEQIAEKLEREIRIIKPEGMDWNELNEEEQEEANKLDVLKGKAQSVIDELNQHIYVIKNYQEESKRKDFSWWLEKDKDRGGVDLNTASINFKPVKVGQKLSDSFFNKEGLTTILTSATLSVGGTFDYIKEETGLSLCTIPIKEFIGESPFNLKEQQLWYLPPDAVNGNDNEAFDSLFTRQIEKIIRATNGGVLCLFTSVKNMNKAYNELQWSDISCTMLKQGTKPRIQLIDQFKSDKNSILFATKSFFTGIDVPGDALRCVIIDKFPFPSPADPVMQKLGKEDNSFFKYFIPMMVIDLKQAIGRGVRSVDDKCVVAILDNRMATARYKARINGSFPYEKTATRDLDAITEFLGTIAEDYNESLEDDGDIPF